MNIYPQYIVVFIIFKVSKYSENSPKFHQDCPKDERGSNNHTPHNNIAEYRVENYVIIEKQYLLEYE